MPQKTRILVLGGGFGGLYAGPGEIVPVDPLTPQRFSDNGGDAEQEVRL